MMTTANLNYIVGAILISFPICLIFVVMAYESGWRVAVTVWGITFVLVALLVTGVLLLTDVWSIT